MHVFVQYGCLNYFVSNRPSSPDLAQAAITGIRVLGGEVKDYGVVTTPMLHYFVACINTDGVYGEATEDGYFKKIITAFKKLRGDVSFVSTLYYLYRAF
jgi:phosphoacetylglucosamine mutase